MSPLVFLVKLLHTAAVLYLLLCLAVIWQYALTGLYRRWLGLAIASVLLEGAVYVGWGFRCPLTDWAIALGDDTGADLIQEWLLIGPNQYVPSYALFFAVGTLLAGKRYWTER